MHVSCIQDGLCAYYSYGLHDDVSAMPQSYAPNWELKITYSAALYSNATGVNEHLGYSFGFSSGLHNHTVLASPDSLDRAMITLNRFDGSTYVADTEVNGNLTKRSSSGPWLSYTNWGDNVGYVYDLSNWGEYKKAAIRMAKDNDFLDSVVQTQDCTEVGCYGYQSKFCVGLQFSKYQGKNDAEVGEIYMDAYGGLDSECDTA